MACALDMLGQDRELDQEQEDLEELQYLAAQQAANESQEIDQHGISRDDLEEISCTQQAPKSVNQALLDVADTGSTIQ